MEETKVLKCPNCYAPLDVTKAVDGVVQCEYCKDVITLPKTAEGKDALQLEIGHNHLNNCDFDSAYNTFSEVSRSVPDEPEAYFGMALATFKIQYIHDKVNNRLQPVCHDIFNKKFTEDKNYQKALTLSKMQKARCAEYKAKGEAIDYIIKQFYELAKEGVKYDTFICVKVTEENGTRHTEDSHTADGLYHTLADKGYKPFYSEREIRGRVGADYEALILYALHVAKSLIIVCSDESYLRTPWVANEYTRYIELMGNEKKAAGSIAIFFQKTPIEQLPGIRGKIQGICSTSPDAYMRIFEFVEKFNAISVATPQLKRKKYVETTYEKKKVIQTNIEKRKFDTAVKVEAISASDASRLKNAEEFLQKRNFPHAQRYAEMVAQNSGDARAYWLLFLIEHSVVSDKELIDRQAEITSWTNFEAALARAQTVEERVPYYVFLKEKVVRTGDVSAFKEYFALPDSNGSASNVLIESMYKRALSKKDTQLFDTVIKYVTNVDKYIAMNLEFARNVQNVKYYKAILEVDAGHHEALWQRFLLEDLHGATLESFCTNKNNFAELEEKLFSYGFNSIAFDALYKLTDAMSVDEKSIEFIDFLLSLLPQKQEKLFLECCRDTVYKALCNNNLKVASYYNKRLLESDKYDYEAHFVACMVNNNVLNPYDLLKKSSLLDDPEYIAAMDCYTEVCPDKHNAFIDMSSGNRAAMASISKGFSKLSPKIRTLSQIGDLKDAERKKDADEKAWKALRQKNQRKASAGALFYVTLAVAAFVVVAIYFFKDLLPYILEKEPLYHLPDTLVEIFPVAVPAFLGIVAFVVAAINCLRQNGFWYSLLWGVLIAAVVFILMSMVFIVFFWLNEIDFDVKLRGYFIPVFLGSVILIIHLVISMRSLYEDDTMFSDLVVEGEFGFGLVIVSVLASSILIFLGNIAFDGSSWELLEISRIVGYVSIGVSFLSLILLAFSAQSFMIVNEVVSFCKLGLLIYLMLQVMSV